MVSTFRIRTHANCCGLPTSVGSNLNSRSSGVNPCSFRGDKEWRALFEVLQLGTLVHNVSVNRHCARPTPRALYVLEQPQAAASTTGSSSEGRKPARRERAQAHEVPT